jgi:ankyrin repeat protein
MEGSIDANTLDATISQLSQADLLCPSTNGFNHLFDAYRLPFRNYSVLPQEATLKSTTIANLLFKQAKSISDDTLFSLLTALNHESSTPLHEVLENGDQNSVEEFLSQLLASGHEWDPTETDPVEVEICPLTHFTILVSRNVFLAQNNRGLTPMDQAFLSNDPGKLEALLQGARSAVQAGILTQDQYLTFLTAPNIHGITPLRAALLSGNDALARVFFESLQAALHDGLLTEEEYLKIVTEALSSRDLALISQYPGIKAVYTEVLTAPDQNGNTLLHRAFASKNPRIVNTVFQTVQRAFDNRVLDASDYRGILTTCDGLGRNLVQLALTSNKSEIVDVCFQTMQYAFDARILRKKEYQNLLTACDENGNTPLHLALASKKLDIANAYLRIMSDAQTGGVLGDSDYCGLWMGKNRAGQTPLHLALASENSELANTCLQILQSAFENDLFNAHQCEFILTTCDRNGDTPFHVVCASENIDLMNAYSEVLSTAREHSALSDRTVRGLMMAENKVGYTPLDKILISGNPDILQIFVTQMDEMLDKYDINWLLQHTDRNHNTPLHNSAMQGTLEGTKLFLEILPNYLSESELAAALRKKGKDGNPPSYPGKRDELSINALLKTMRTKHPLKTKDSLPNRAIEKQEDEQSTLKRSRADMTKKDAVDSRHSTSRRKIQV